MTAFPLCPPATDLVTIEVDGRKFVLHPAVAPIFKAFLQEGVNDGYRIGTGILDDWSYVCRKIAGSDKWSNHAYAKAIDVNAISNPQRHGLVTDMPPWFINLGLTKYHLTWGGNYHAPTKQDAMHWEWTKSIEEAEALVHALGLDGSQPIPAPTPVPVQEDSAVHFYRSTESGKVYAYGIDGAGYFKFHVLDAATYAKLHATATAPKELKDVPANTDANFALYIERIPPKS